MQFAVYSTSMLHYCQFTVVGGFVYAPGNRSVVSKYEHIK